jgi:hypothetical protein
LECFSEIAIRARDRNIVFPNCDNPCLTKASKLVTENEMQEDVKDAEGGEDGGGEYIRRIGIFKIHTKITSSRCRGCRCEATIALELIYKWCSTRRVYISVSPESTRYCEYFRT